MFTVIHIAAGTWIFRLKKRFLKLQSFLAICRSQSSTYGTVLILNYMHVLIILSVVCVCIYLCLYVGYTLVGPCRA